MNIIPPIDRRQFLKTLAISTSALAMPAIPFAKTPSNAQPFRVPPLASATRNGNKVQFQLNVQQGHTEFLPGLMTPTWGYNGGYLGPMLRVRRGEKVSISVTNNIDYVSTVHWHGMILPAAMDGGPHQQINPGETWVSEFDVIQPASTLFYHSHAFHQTGTQVYYGLAGPLIIDDENSDELDLPSEYGVDDLPVIIQDRDFNEDGSFRYVTFMPERMIGKHGKTIMVNGVVAPHLKAQKTLLRLRLNNASNARFYKLAFDDNRPFQVIGSDGGLLEAPVTVNQLDMAPAERFEVLVDVSDKKQVILQSLPGAGNANHGPMRMMGMDGQFDILYIDASEAKKSEHTPPAQLVRHDDWSSPNITATRSVNLEMAMMTGGDAFTINGKSMDMSRIDFRLKKNTFEIWNIGNNSPMVHPFHVHNTQFKVLSRNGNEPAAIEAGFKDTVVVNSGETVKILMPTGPYSDPNGHYMHHCHILEHEDAGMMGQFIVED